MRVIIFLFINYFANAQNAFQIYKAPDGVKVVFEDSGNGEAILLLHGFINTGDNWRRTELYKKLISDGYRVIVPDMRGNGRSDKPHGDKFYENDVEVADLMGIISQLKIKKYKVVGYSRGSIVAAKLLTKDKRISKAVLGGMGEQFTNPTWDRRLMFADAFSGKAHLHPETQGAVKYATSIGADTLSLGYLQKFQPVTSLKALTTIKIPVLILCGDKDRDNGSPEVLVSYFTKGELKIVPGVHNTTYQSTAFAEAVKEFIK